MRQSLLLCFQSQSLGSSLGANERLGGNQDHVQIGHFLLIWLSADKNTAASIARSLNKTVFQRDSASSFSYERKKEVRGVLRT